jgi:endoglucanase
MNLYAGSICCFDFGKITQKGEFDKLVNPDNLYFYKADIVGFSFKNRKSYINPFLDKPEIDNIKNFSVKEDGKLLTGIKIIGKEINLTNLYHSSHPDSPGDYEAVVFIQLPHNMHKNKIYSFSSTLYNYLTRVVKWEPDRILSQSIKVNQIAYAIQSSIKYAKLGKWLGSAGPVTFDKIKQFNIIDCSTGKIVFSGTPELTRKSNTYNETPYKINLSGENLYTIDISKLTKEGAYFISIPEVGRSYSFRISEDAFAEPLYSTIRMLYHNRCGIALTKEYTKWTRNICRKHTNLIVVPEYDKSIKWDNDFKGIQKFLETNKDRLKYKKVYGGYHDAGDYDRRHMHMRIPMLLSFAYENNSSSFTDGQFNIPESGNGVPDILDEAYFGLIFSLKTQWPDGGIPAGSEANHHPSTDQGNDWCTNVDNETTTYVILPVIQQSTIKFAAAAAQLSYLLKNFPEYKERSEKLLNAAEKAYKLAVRKFSPASDKERVWFCTAATELLRTTQNRLYASDIATYMPEHFDFMNDPGSAIFATAYSLLPSSTPGFDQKLNKQLTDKFQKPILKALNSYIKNESYIMFRHPAAPIMCGTGNGAQTMIPSLCYIATKNKKIREYLYLTADTMLGENPAGTVFATGIGQKHIKHPLHLESMNDSLNEPVPGCWTYAPYSKKTHRLEKRSRMFPPKKQRPPYYRYFDIAQCPPAAEFTVWENIAPITLLFGILTTPESSKNSK